MLRSETGKPGKFSWESMKGQPDAALRSGARRACSRRCYLPSAIAKMCMSMLTGRVTDTTVLPFSSGIVAE